METQLELPMVMLKHRLLRIPMVPFLQALTVPLQIYFNLFSMATIFISVCNLGENRGLLPRQGGP